MSLRPLNDHIIFEIDPEEPTDSNPEVVRILKEGTIQIPDAYKGSLVKVSPTGRIVSWGDRCRYKAWYEVGKRIHFRQFASTKLFDNFRVISEQDLVALYEEEK